ncbi:hypothetical protein SNE40_007472 [Patella caerulea]|uniref:Superoxide dismutase [Cu-Zn] n=1 Tax=Patella caerulea TaxID=87958 RepID=A0AAN8JYK4_PATCE
MASGISGSIRHISTSAGDGVSINLNSLLHMAQLLASSSMSTSSSASQVRAVGCHTGRVYASCAMQASTGSLVSGFIDFAQNVNDRCEPLGNLEIKVELSGLTNNDNIVKHGLHVHQLGDLSNGCTSTGSHYNPLNSQHGAPNSQIRHVGDLGNVREDGFGNIRAVLSDSMASLVGPYSINGRAMVLHANEDDLGRGGNSGSTTTGNAGGRLGCCVIGHSDGSRWRGANRRQTIAIRQEDLWSKK